MRHAYQIEFVVDNKILADEAGGRAVASKEHRHGPIDMITQRLLSRGWWPRQYSCPLVVWRRRSWNKLADKLCNLAIDTQQDHRFEAVGFRTGHLEQGSLFQCHSDGGVRGPGNAAAGFTLALLKVNAVGDLSRTLICAASVFITDVNMTAPWAERIALTMAMREMDAFTSNMAPISSNL